MKSIPQVVIDRFYDFVLEGDQAVLMSPPVGGGVMGGSTAVTWISQGRLDDGPLATRTSPRAFWSIQRARRV